MIFKVGDKVKLIVNDYNLDGEGSGPVLGAVLEVKENCDTRGLWIDKTSVQLKNINEYYSEDFEPIEQEKLKTKFSLDDRVISIKNTPEVPEGYIGYVVEDPLVDVVGRWDYAVRKENNALQTEYFNEDELELLSAGQTAVPSPQDKPSSALHKQVSGDHYKDCKIQPIEYIHANGLSYLEGNVIKYTTRHSKKNGRKDIEKAIHYLELILEMEYKDKE